MKVNRDIVVRAGLDLLDKVGLEELTLRRLAAELNVQAPTLYWHFRSKLDLIDAMATLLLAEGTQHLRPARRTTNWQVSAEAFGRGLRKALLTRRDGARMVAGTHLTDTIYMESVESIAKVLVDAGFTIRQAAILLSTIYDYTLSLVTEEQAMSPPAAANVPQYDLAERKRRLDDIGLRLMGQSGTILFGNFERRHREGLALIIQGAASQRRNSRRPLA